MAWLAVVKLCIQVQEGEAGGEVAGVCMRAPVRGWSTVALRAHEAYVPRSAGCRRGRQYRSRWRSAAAGAWAGKHESTAATRHLLAWLPADFAPSSPNLKSENRICLQETVEKTHYSVDMLLAVAVAALVWHWRGAACPAASPLPPRPAGAPRDPVPLGLVALVGVTLAVVFVGVAGT